MTELNKAAANTIIYAALAECGQPDTPDSPGAKFLNSVADAVADAIENGEDDERILNEIANDAPAMSTHEKWEQFVDLRGYRVDTTDQYGDRISARNLTDHVNGVLVVIADNLIRALIAEHEAKNEGE
jgi:hypothetical protein